jgi:hypothetical protein
LLADLRRLSLLKENTDQSKIVPPTTEDENAEKQKKYVNGQEECN